MGLGGIGRASARGAQFGDNLDFVNGTIAHKRVRIVGLGNIGSRYARFVHCLGAEVGAWDPLAAALVKCLEMGNTLRQSFSLLEGQTPLDQASGGVC